eukprot:915319-Rhodomonas_salina.1
MTPAVKLPELAPSFTLVSVPSGRSTSRMAGAQRGSASEDRRVAWLSEDRIARVQRRSRTGIVALEDAAPKFLCWRLALLCCRLLRGPRPAHPSFCAGRWFEASTGPLRYERIALLRWRLHGTRRCGLTVKHVDGDGNALVEVVFGLLGVDEQKVVERLDFDDRAAEDKTRASARARDVRRVLWLIPANDAT